MLFSCKHLSHVSKRKQSQGLSKPWGLSGCPSNTPDVWHIHSLPRHL